MTRMKSTWNEGDTTRLTRTADALAHLLFTVVQSDDGTGAIPCTPRNVNLIHALDFADAFAIQAKHGSGKLVSGVLGDHCES
jgi:hypothetical protein